MLFTTKTKISDTTYFGWMARNQHCLSVWSILAYRWIQNTHNNKIYTCGSRNPEKFSILDKYFQQKTGLQPETIPWKYTAIVPLWHGHLVVHWRKATHIHVLVIQVLYRHTLQRLSMICYSSLLSTSIFNYRSVQACSTMKLWNGQSNAMVNAGSEKDRFKAKGFYEQLNLSTHVRNSMRSWTKNRSLYRLPRS